MTEPDGDRLIWMYAQMLRIREFEERVKRTFTEHPGVIRGHTHLADGAEASIVGALSTLKDGDQLLTTYRCHGYPLVLGTDPRAMMAEIYGRTRRSVRRLRRLDAPARSRRAGSSAPPGSSARGSRRRPAPPTRRRSASSDQVVLCFFGDGASKQGAFAESLNVASLWKLPIVYVMENNSYNVVTRVEQEDANAAAGEPLAVKAKAYSMPGVTVDGGDPVAVYETVGAAVDARPLGRGPDAGRVQGLPAQRPRQHHRAAGRAAALPRARGDQVFGNREEYEAALRGDPVPRFRARLVSDGTLGAARGRRDRGRGPRRDGGGGAVRARQPVPGARSGPRPRLRVSEEPNDGTRDPLHRCDQRGDPPRDGPRRHASCTSARTSRRPRTTRSSRRSAATACA